MIKLRTKAPVIEPVVYAPATSFQMPKDISVVLNEDEMCEWDERSAIMEYDGMLSREKAEHEAYNIVMLKRSMEQGIVGSILGSMGAFELKGATNGII